MPTILYQGRPSDQERWMVLPDHCVPTYLALGYQVREFLLREEAFEEAAKVAEAADVGSHVIALQTARDIATRLRGLKKKAVGLA